MASHAAGLQHLDTANLREHAKASLRTGIVTGAIGGSELHSARSLATELGVSATPVREALLDLVNEGLVVPVRNRGFRVVEMTDHDLDEVYELRLIVEVPATARAAPLLTESDFGMLGDIAERIQREARTGDIAGLLEHDQQFHLRILSRLGNQRLVDLCARLRNQVRLTGLSKLASEGELERTASEHPRLVAALRGGDPDTITRLMISHIGHTRGVWVGRDEAT